MKPSNLFYPNELTCSKCHRALEVSVVEEFGELREYLQCWHCFQSVPSHTMRIPIHKHTNGNAAKVLIYHTWNLENKSNQKGELWWIRKKFFI